MLVTVKEAKSKVCPLGMEDGEGQSTCYGPECMAWRWAEGLERRVVVCENAMADSQPIRPSVVPATWEFEPYDQKTGEPAGWVEPRPKAMERRRGYCGMAGKLERLEGLLSSEEVES